LKLGFDKILLLMGRVLNKKKSKAMRKIGPKAKRSRESSEENGTLWPIEGDKGKRRGSQPKNGRTTPIIS
jgi:hypothetical protein